MNNIEIPVGVKIHPIALLSVVDHHERTVGNKKNKRAIGVLLGENVNGILEVTNSYAVPFDELRSKKGVWFFDHNYHEKMFDMFKKINIREKILGWYATGKTFLKHDIQINELFAKYTQNPVLIVIDVDGKNSLELPTKAFYSDLQVNTQGYLVRQFKNISCSVSAFEAEEVGVEHLVREIKDLNMNSLQNKMVKKVNSLIALQKKIDVIVTYLNQVINGERKQDQEILKVCQQIMNKLPKILNNDLKRILSEKTNDNYLNLYISSIVRGVVNLHNLLNNRIKNAEENQEKEQQEIKDKEQKEVTTKAGQLIGLKYWLQNLKFFQEVFFDFNYVNRL